MSRVIIEQLSNSVPPWLVVTDRASERGPSPTSVNASTFIVYVLLVSRLVTVVSWLLSTGWTVHNGVGRSGVSV